MDLKLYDLGVPVGTDLCSVPERHRSKGCWWCRLTGYHVGTRIEPQGRPSALHHRTPFPWPVFKKLWNIQSFPLPVEVFFLLAIPLPAAAPGLEVTAGHPARSAEYVEERLA